VCVKNYVIPPANPHPFAAQEKLQSPLQVLNCLAVENGPKLASVRDYFLQIFQKESEITKQEEKFTEQFRTDSIKFRGLIKNIQENPMEFRGTVCTTCCQPLNLPALHFLCQHSYHQE
jgi:vacuolar protein sorting-associated protein 11